MNPHKFGSFIANVVAIVAIAFWLNVLPAWLFYLKVPATLLLSAATFFILTWLLRVPFGAPFYVRGALARRRTSGSPSTR